MSLLITSIILAIIAGAFSVSLFTSGYAIAGTLVATFFFSLTFVAGLEANNIYSKKEEKDHE